jgi:ABC-type bacteriocin/lantibiotic exporter with double-glycine peptidase domain
MMDWIKNRTLKRDWFGKFPKAGLYLALGWLASLSTFFLSLMTGWFFDLHFQSHISKAELLEKSGLKIDSLSTFFWVMGLVICLKFILQYVERKGINQDVDRFIHDLVAKMYRRQLRWNPALFESRPFSRYLLRYSGDLQPIRNLLAQGIHRGIRDSFFVLSGLALLVWLNPAWTVLLLTLTAVAIPLFRYLDQRQLQLIPERRTRKNELLHFVTETFSSQKSLYENQKVEKTIRSFKRKNEDVLQSNLNYQHLESLRHAGVNVLGPILVGFLLFTSWGYSQPTSPGDLLAYLLVLGALVPAIRNVVKAPEIIEKGMLSLKKVERLVKKPRVTPTPVLSVDRNESQANFRQLPKEG